MKNKLMIMGIVIFTPTAMIAMQLPDYSTRELKNARYHAKSSLENLYSNKWKRNQFWIDGDCDCIKNALHMIEFSNSMNNTTYPDEIGKISDKDMKELKHTFYTKLQVTSQKKATKYIKKNAADGNFYQAARVVNMQDKLCRDFIKAEGFDCAAIHETLKELIKGEMQKTYDLLENSIQAEPHILAKDIQDMTERSEKDVLNKKQKQLNLNKIWIDMNSGIL
jgi:hypothetical protein